MRIKINPKYAYLQEQIESIPTLFGNEGDVVYTGRNTLKRLQLENVDVVVKSFKKPHVVNRIAYSFFRMSKAERSFVYSMRLREHGVDTPEPVAMIEQYQHGFLLHSYYICCYDNGETVRDLMGGRVGGNEEQLLAFARYTASLHEVGILHLDYSPGNILNHRNEDGGYSFSLVDVNRMQLLRKIDCETVCRNMCRLCTSREVLAYIMTEYASLRGWDVQSTVRLALHYSDRFFTHYVYREAARKEGKKEVLPRIFMFRLYRTVRKSLSPSSRLSHYLLAQERRAYDIYLRSYDYCNLLYPDYE